MNEKLLEIARRAFPDETTNSDSGCRNFVTIKICNGMQITAVIATIILCITLFRLNNSYLPVEPETACILNSQQILKLDRIVRERVKKGETYQKIYSDWRKKYGKFKKSEMPCEIFDKIAAE